MDFERALLRATTSWSDVFGSLLARTLVGFAYGVGFALAWRLLV